MQDWQLLILKVNKKHCRLFRGNFGIIQTKFNAGKLIKQNNKLKQLPFIQFQAERSGRSRQVRGGSSREALVARTPNWTQ
jgi:hypothetical protein